MTVAAEVSRPDPDPEVEQPADDTEPSEPSTEEPSSAPEKGGPASQSEADARVAALTAELATLRAKAEDAEKKRIPELQRSIQKKQEELDLAKTGALNFRNSMLEWTRKTMLENGLEEEWKTIERKEQERTGQTLMTQAARAETMETINDLLDSDEPDDRAFGRFLRTQVKAGTEGGVPVTVTKQNLGTYRQMFNGARPAPAASAAETPAPAPKPTSAAPAATQPAPKKPLPKVPGASGAPQTQEEAAWKPGTSIRALFTRAYDARRQAGE